MSLRGVVPIDMQPCAYSDYLNIKQSAQTNIPPSLLLLSEAAVMLPQSCTLVATLLHSNVLQAIPFVDLHVIPWFRAFDNPWKTIFLHIREPVFIKVSHIWSTVGVFLLPARSVVISGDLFWKIQRSHRGVEYFDTWWLLLWTTNCETAVKPKFSKWKYVLKSQLIRAYPTWQIEKYCILNRPRLENPAKLFTGPVSSLEYLYVLGISYLE